MPVEPKGLALAAKITALTTGTGPTAGQKTRLQNVVNIIDSRLVNGTALDNDLARIYDELNALA